MRHHPLAELRIGVFGKGGSGKSTITVFLAHALREARYSVVVLDADSTNFGLAGALGTDRDPDPLLEYFGGMVFSGGAVTCPVDDPTPLAGALLDLRTLPDRFVARTADEIQLLTLGKIGSLWPGAGCDGPVAKIARDVRVVPNGSPVVTLLDFKAGFEDAARGAITTVDRALVTVDPTIASIRMARDLSAMVAAIRSGQAPATKHLESQDLVLTAERVFAGARVRGVNAVLSRTHSLRAEEQLRTALMNAGMSADAVFPDDRAIMEQWLRGERLRSLPLRASAQALVQQLERIAADHAAVVPA